MPFQKNVSYKYKNISYGYNVSVYMYHKYTQYILIPGGEMYSTEKMSSENTIRASILKKILVKWFYKKGKEKVQKVQKET